MPTLWQQDIVDLISHQQTMPMTSKQLAIAALLSSLLLPGCKTLPEKQPVPPTPPQESPHKTPEKTPDKSASKPSSDSDTASQSERDQGKPAGQTAEHHQNKDQADGNKSPSSAQNPSEQTPQGTQQQAGSNTSTSDNQGWGLTGQEQSEAEKALDEAAKAFDEQMMAEQERQAREQAAQANTGSQERETGGEQETGESERGGNSGNNDDSGGSHGGAVGGGGQGKTYPPPADIPPGTGDDVVARQLREAAMREPDPEVRKKLWDEYRKYKGIK